MVMGMRAPIRGSRSAVDVVAVTIIAPIMGKKASPVLMGEYPSVVCR